MNALIGIVATLVLLFQAGYLFVGMAWASMHGAGISWALFIILAPIAILWASFFILKAKKYKHRALVLILLSITLILGLELILPQTPLKSLHAKNNIQKTEVLNIKDEPAYDDNGNLLGIRISFDAIFPQAGMYSVSPSIAHQVGKENKKFDLQFTHLTNIKVEPAPLPVSDHPGARLFKGSQTYHFSYDTLPGFLMVDQRLSQYCIHFYENINYSEQTLLDEINASVAAPYNYEIHLNSWTNSDARRYIDNLITKNTYSVKQIYEQALNAGAQRCK